MKLRERLVYKSYNTCFQTSLPVFFYGMPSGKILLLFNRLNEEFYLKKTLEWVLAVHLDFWFDYEEDAVMDFQNRKLDLEEFMELADNLEQRIKTIATFGNFPTNTDAQKYFNQNVFNMLLAQNQEKYAVEYF